MREHYQTHRRMENPHRGGGERSPKRFARISKFACTSRTLGRVTARGGWPPIRFASLTYRLCRVGSTRPVFVCQLMNSVPAACPLGIDWSPSERRVVHDLFMIQTFGAFLEEFPARFQSHHAGLFINYDSNEARNAMVKIKKKLFFATHWMCVNLGFGGWFRALINLGWVMWNLWISMEWMGEDWKGQDCSLHHCWSFGSWKVDFHFKTELVVFALFLWIIYQIIWGLNSNCSHLPSCRQSLPLHVWNQMAESIAIITCSNLVTYLRLLFKIFKKN